MTLWTLNLNADNDEGKKPSKEDEDHEKAFQYCFNNNIAGIGWPVSREPKTPNEYEELARAEYAKDNDPSPAIAFVKEVEYKDLIWIQSSNETYYLGEVTGDWIYKASGGLGFVNQRPCVWKKIGTIDEAPTETIKQRFVIIDIALNTPETLQRISNTATEKCSEEIYARK